MWNLENNGTDEPIFRARMETRPREWACGHSRKWRGGMSRKSSLGICTLPCAKQMNGRTLRAHGAQPGALG